ncbi:MAG TPA: calcium-binding protein [Deltaproteobacteria bacterium]|jgi:Ca2+-binding RTX toxin-like protein|nr:calcium-binding protein [Deltaproteobacteria bacterium]HOI06471.1 calcium-binding protein [Deltaproteobacteria bacterium]
MEEKSSDVVWIANPVLHDDMRSARTVADSRVERAGYVIAYSNAGGGGEPGPEDPGPEPGSTTEGGTTPQHVIFSGTTTFPGEETLSFDAVDSRSDGASAGMYKALAGGGSGDDTLSGTPENDTLDGGAGADTMYGGTGDDTYLMENPGDRAIELASEGNDTIRSTVSATLPAHVENLFLDGAGDLYGIGNELDNALTGNTGNNILSGLAGNDTLDGGAGGDTMYGGSGDDTFLVEDARDTVIEAVAQGHDTVMSTVSFTLTGNVEDLTLMGIGDTTAIGNELDNRITGNAGNNTLRGGPGRDTLDGAAGADTLFGGAGDDVYLVDSGGDVVIEGDEEGIDTVISSASHTLNFGVDHLVLTGAAAAGTGNPLDNLITGNAGSNTLTGMAGNDTLDGGAGADAMTGGEGDDVYLVDDAGDIVTENQGEGSDTVLSSIAFTLGSHVENLFLMGDASVSGVGNALDNTLTGNTGGNALEGSAGNDTLDGGAGADTLIGGEGDDTFLVDSPMDAVIEHDGQGYDRVLSSASFTLGGNVEELALMGNAATGTGNSLDNRLTGNNARNVLTGLAGNDTLDGGAGADTMSGGTGDDGYIVDSAGDVVVEQAGEGSDWVAAAIDSYTLPANVEALYLRGPGAGSGAGNALDNYIAGNWNSNTLSGGAGNDTLDGWMGSDTLAGGTGDDTIWVYSTEDVVIEHADEGTDTVVSYISYTLGPNLENLDLSHGTGLHGTGNEKANVMYGSGSRGTLAGLAGNDTLFGGTGSDTLSGGAGDDILAGSTGNDHMEGGSGSDTYRVGPHEGQDVISNSDASPGRQDCLVLTEGITPAAVSLTRDGSDLVVATGDAAHTVRVVSFFTSDTNALDTITFLDGPNGTAGTVWDLAYIKAQTLTTQSPTDGDDVLTGTPENDSIDALAGNDLIYGLSGDDVLRGGPGNDTLEGGEGSDAYLFGRGDGSDTIYNNDDLASSSDVLLFDNGIAPADAALIRVADDLLVSVTGTNDRVLINGYFISDGNGGYALDSIRFADGTVWDVNTVKLKLLQGTPGNDLISGYASPDVADGFAGNDTIFGNGGSDTLRGGDGDDVLSGGQGNDVLQGDAGNDTYLFGAQDGQDTIANNEPSQSGFDVLLLDSGISPDMVTLERSSDDLVLKLNGTAAQALILNYFAHDGTNGSAVDEIRFANGTTWDVNTVRSMVVQSTAGDDLISGSSAPDIIDGLAGNDTILGNGGNDHLIGGAGDDFLSGGEGDDSLSGSPGNDTLDGGPGADTMTGGIGNDVYLLDSPADVVTEVAGEGNDTVCTPFTHTLGGTFEDLILTGSAAVNGTGNSLDNRLTGNSARNVLTGLAGNDTLDGGAGADTMVGGAGDDVYCIDSTSDKITEKSGQGTDTVLSSITFTLGSNLEKLTLTGSAAIKAKGNSLNNVLVGNSANNALSGGTGADTMAGGPGNDTYTVDNVSDIVMESPDEGIDTVSTSLTYVLGDNAENLKLTGYSSRSGTGNALDNWLTGNSARNVLTGLAGNDTLDGGAGADTMIGGTGDDTYVVGSSSDKVLESAGEGVDTVRSSTTYTLGSNLENLTLTGISSIKGTGNDLDNCLTGNSANNRLTGGAGNDTLDGGSGRDTLIGGIGNDVYVVERSTDKVTENAGEGTDTVLSSVTFTLAANVENLTLTGTAAINGTGNALDNVITGNSAGNVLDGGTGNDTLMGGAGNDTYVVDTPGDVIVENPAEGIDTVSCSFTCALASEVENLTLTGAAAISGTGNDLDNYLTGNSAGNSLTGGAGNDTLDGCAGSDTMRGGPGDDTCCIDSPSDMVIENAGEGIDTIRSSITYTLGSTFENLTLTGTAAISGTGNDLDNRLTGNSAGNTLTGGAGNDTLDGSAGADTLAGGTGDDTYVVDSTSDRITENPGEGTDTVLSSVTWTLGSDLENLTLTGTSSIGGIGNSLGNYLIGNSASNTLAGGEGNDTLDGGAGADTLAGGFGDDTYIVNSITDSLIDRIIEHNVEGRDTILSSITYTLGSGIENLTLTGTAAISGSGNSLDNYLTGNSAPNYLTSGQGQDTLDGGPGADTMYGGTGDDTYFIDDAGDEAIEYYDDYGMHDTLMSSITTGLAPYIENLTLIGSSDIDGYGNYHKNVLTGNSGKNFLKGDGGADTLAGGAGNDTLEGDDGDDIYRFGQGDGQDTIVNNSTAEDVDTLSFVDAARRDLWFSRSGNDLVMTVAGTTDRVTVSDWYGGSVNQLDRLTAEGCVLHNTMVDRLVNAMASYAVPYGAGNVIPQDVQDALAPLIASAWQPEGIS